VSGRTMRIEFRRHSMGGRGAGGYAGWRLSNRLLVVANILLVAGLVWVVVWPSSVPGVDTPARSALGAESSSPAEPLSGYRDVLRKRSLFVLPVATSAGRGLEDAIGRAKSKLALRGIVDVSGRKGAYFEVEQGSGTSFDLYFEGDQVGEFTVERILPGQVHLSIGGHEVSFSL